MNKNINKHTFTTILPLLLFTIFTCCILIVLLTGADIYQKINKRDQNTFAKRTTVQYLTTRIRQNDGDLLLFAGDFESFPDTKPDMDSAQGNTLFLMEEIDGRIYTTRIYCYDGHLFELFTEEGLETLPQFGEPILEVSSLEFLLDGRHLIVNVTYPDNIKDTISLYLRSSQEVSQ